MSDVFERLEIARKYLGLSFKDLSELFGLTPDGANKAIKNKRLSVIQINTLADAYNINKDWLKTGEGEILNSEIKELEENQPISEVIELNRLLKIKENQIIALKENLGLLKDKINIISTNSSKEKIEFLEKQNDFLLKVILEKFNDFPVSEIKEMHELMTRNLLKEKIEEARDKLSSEKKILKEKK